MQKRFIDRRKAGEATLARTNIRRKEASQQLPVFQMTKEPSHCVEGLRQVGCAAPVTSAQRRAISDQAAECRRHANRTAWVGSDRGNGRSLENAGGRAAG